MFQLLKRSLRLIKISFVKGTAKQQKDKKDCQCKTLSSQPLQLELSLVPATDLTFKNSYSMQ